MTSGLDALDAARNKAARRIPPPQHQPRSTPVLLPEPAADQAAPEEKPRMALRPQEASSVRSVPADKPTEPTAQDDLAKFTVYFDEATDDYLNDVLTAGRKHRPRLSLSRSAVVRLALSRLADEMTPGQVVAEISRRAPERTGTGRQRL